MNSPDSRLALLTAILGAVAVAVKKALGSGRPGKPAGGYVTKTEFHQGLDAMRDRLTAGYLAIGEKMDTTHREVLGAIESQRASVETRLDHLETTLARVDERTKLAQPPK